MDYYSNCVIEVLRARRRLRAAGVAFYLWSRMSLFRWSPFHVGWEIKDPATGAMRKYSFKPVDGGRDVPLYMAWTRLLFKGRIVEGDELPAPATYADPEMHDIQRFGLANTTNDKDQPHV